MDELDELRQALDRLDTEIMTLLEKRFEISEAVGEIKKTHKIPLTHAKREQTILNRATAYKHQKSIESVYLTIFKQSKQKQK